MTTMQKVLATVAVAGFSAAAYAGFTDEFSAFDAGGTLIAERQAATLTVGTKKVVTYYVRDAGSCNVALLVSETYPEQVPYHLASVRFSAKVAEGATAEVAASDGAALALTCSAGAKHLAVVASDLARPVVTPVTN